MREMSSGLTYVVVTALVVAAFAVGFVASTMVAPGGPDGGGNGGGNGNGSQQQVVTVYKQNVTVIDDYGNLLEFETVPETIVSLAPSNTEILYALGLGDKVVAADLSSNYPADVVSKATINTWPSVDVESVVSHNPDLVLAHDINRPSVPALREQGLKVVALNPKTLEDIYSSIRMVGYITGTLDEAEAVVSDMEARAGNISAALAGVGDAERPKVFYDMGAWEGKYSSTGPGTFQDDLIRLAGGVNIAAATGIEWPQLSVEYIVETNPDVIIYTTWSTFNTEVPEQFEGVKAVLDQRMHLIDEDTISRTGPRVIEAMEELFSWLHPDLASSL